MVFGILFLFAYLFFFESPKERKLKQTNEELQYQYEELNRKIEGLSMVLEDLRKRDDNVYRLIFEAEPIPLSIRKAGFGGANRYEELERKGNLEIAVETHKKLDIISKEMYIQSKSFDEIIKLAKNKEGMLKSIPAIIPIENKTLTGFASGFGYRIHPIYKTILMHTGIDLTARTGTKIYATGDGVVSVADYERGYGKMVKIYHGYTYETLYGHMSKIMVKRGQKVRRGDVVGLVGNTGTSTGPHLHYEVRKNGGPVNPINYYLNDLTPQQYREIIDLSNDQNQSLD